MPNFNCFQCGTQISWPDHMPLGRRDVCPQCDADLRSCRHCRHYEPSAQWECRERISENVPNKERANFCDHFQLNEGSKNPQSSGSDRSDLLKAAENLFKKG